MKRGRSPAERITRKVFLAGAGATAVGSAVGGADKDGVVVDGRLPSVEPPGVPPRRGKLLPPGVLSRAHFTQTCVGCQLCVAACPNGVLRRSPGVELASRPMMGFERGWCRPECTVCGAVCPTGAIRPLTVARKRDVKIGTAVLTPTRCERVRADVSCDLCVRKCPSRAIALVPFDAAYGKSKKVPRVDADKCIGCGCCENLCPSRPLPALAVQPS